MKTRMLTKGKKNVRNVASAANVGKIRKKKSQEPIVAHPALIALSRAQYKILKRLLVASFLSDSLLEKGGSLEDWKKAGGQIIKVNILAQRLMARLQDRLSGLPVPLPPPSGQRLPNLK